jgi:hypothetical protein
MEIEGKNGQLVTSQRGAHFSVAQNEQTVAVATTTGVVDLQAAGKTVSIKRGEQASASNAEPPTPPQTISKEVLLKIAGPAQLTLQAGNAMNGLTQPGNRVFVAGKPVAVDAQGRFSIILRVKPGTKQISVVTEDPQGRRKQRTLRILAIRSQSPIKKVQMQWHKQQTLDVKWQNEDQDSLP